MTSLDRYMVRLVGVPLAATLTIAAMLLVLDRMLRLFDFVANEGGPVRIVWQMLANLLPEYLGLGVPIGLLLGCLLAFRRIAASSELDVMRGVGLSYGRLLRVPYMYAIALALFNLAIVGFIQPYARFHYERLRFELRSGALGASIKVGEFTTLGDRLTLRIDESRDEGRDLRNIFLRARTRPGQTLAVTAAGGRFLASGDPDTILLRLTNGTLVHSSDRFETPRVLTFSVHDLPIDLPRTEAFRGRGGRDRELTLPELARVGGDDGQSSDQRNGSWAEFHFRLVEVATIFLLPMLAVALGVPQKRSGSALGVFLAIVMIVTYHKVNEYAAALAELGRIDALLGLWIPFAVFAALVGWMYHVIAHVPGGQPIGAFERFFGKAWQALVARLPGRRRKARP